jgi:hypothetical protein
MPTVNATGAAPAVLIGGTVDIERSVVASTMGLYGSATVVEGASGVIHAGRLTGSSGNDIRFLAATNSISTLGAFNDAGHAFDLVDGSSLNLSGLITANSVVVTTPGAIALTAGGVAGIGAGTFVPTTANPIPSAGAAGVYLKGSAITVLSNPSVSGNGTIDWTFALTGSGNVGLNADFSQPSVKVFLDLASGTASGQLEVAGLWVRYTTASQSTTNLLGSVNGKTGAYAAAASNISPLPKNNYMVNECPISSVNCVKFTGLTVPVTNPLQDVLPAAIQDPMTIDDLLPDIAKRDY